jgi:DNA-binding MarR family transcriptional regulator
VNTHLLIDAIVQQTMVFIAQLATSGGVRAPLAHIADRVFADLTQELQNQGVTKKVIADMFGMALRTYHRRVQETRESLTESGSTVWEAVLTYIKAHEPVSAAEIQRRFVRDDREVVSGVLNDLANSGLAYRTGRGDRAVYRAAAQADFEAAEGSNETIDWLVCLTTYRKGPVGLKDLAQHTGLSSALCETALERLAAEGRVTSQEHSGQQLFKSDRFEVPLGDTQGWEIAVLDHYQAMASAICAKLNERASGATLGDKVGGSTWSLDVWDGHPLYDEATSTLSRVRQELESLRDRIDAHNAAQQPAAPRQRVIFYAGQNLRSE